jgi:hypothetical protein
MTWFIFNWGIIKLGRCINNAIIRLGRCINNANNIIHARYIWQQRMKGHTYFSYTSTVEQAWTRVPHVQTHDPSKLGHVSGMLQIDLVWGGLALLPRGPPKNPKIAQARPILTWCSSLLPGDATLPLYCSVPQAGAASSPRWESGCFSLSIIGLQCFPPSLIFTIS